MTAVERRITFFVTNAERTSTGRGIEGEIGVGPNLPGDEFSFVHHQDGARN
jgi:hypothetical protein